MQVYKQNNKIITSNSGEVLADSDGSSNKILHIDFDLQQRNRIFKEGSNLLKQVTDKVSNIPFVNKGNAIFNYGDGIHSSVHDNTDGFESVGGTGLEFTENTTLEAWISLPEFTTSKLLCSKGLFSSDMSFIFFVTGNNVTLWIYDTTNTPRVIFIAGLSTWTTPNEPIHLAVVKEGSDFGILANGILRHKLTLNYVFKTTPIREINIGYVDNFTSYRFTGNIQYIGMYNDAIYDISGTIGDEVFTPKEPFLYYKRFSPDTDLVANLNSRYLKDCNINTSNIITSLNDEASSGIWSAVGSAMLKNGIGENSVNSRLVLSPNPFATTGIGTRDFLISGMIKIDGSTEYSDLCDFGRIRLGIRYSGGIFRSRCLITGAEDLSNIVINGLNLNSWMHVAAIRRNNILYCTVNGILIGSINSSTDISASSIAYVWQWLGCEIDDFICFVNNSIYNPTGKLVGQKVLEPLRRRSLNNEIIEF